MRRSLRRARYYSLFLVAAAALSSAVAHAETLFHFDLPAQSLAETLRAIGSATNTDIGFAVNQVAGLVAPALRADLTVDGALARVLAGTGFRPRHLNDHTIVIATGKSSVSESLHSKTPQTNTRDSYQQEAYPPISNSTSGSFPLRLAEVDTLQTGQQADETERQKSKGLEDVVVTGSHLRGVTDTGSQLIVVTHEDIERAGYGTVADLVQSIPQAFGGDVTADTVASIRGGGGDNITAGTGIDLRGLGATSTLVLVNGRRLAPSNAQFEGYTDVSNIPLAAIDRIEIVPDGASAIYGSDAVAGVVNFILKKDFEGADSHVRYGTVTDGNSRNIEATQLLGHVWSTGSALLSYEYYDRNALSAADRSYTDTATLPFTLLPQERRNSFFGTATERISTGFELFADGNYSDHSVYQVLSTPSFVLQVPTDSSMYNVTLGGRFQLPDSYQFSVSTSYAASKVSDQVLFNTANAPTTRAHTSVLSVDPIINGSLLDLPSGPIALAVGGQFRREILNEEDAFSGAPFLDNRDVTAVFTEMSIPIVGPDNSIPGLNRLAVTLADRYEHYSDFGSTDNPKIGIVLSPDQSIKLRASYGRSFRAPSLIDLNPIPSSSGAVLDLDPATGNYRPVVDIFGGNADLRPETARTWSFGFDLSPTFISGLHGSATYYRILYTNRIQSANAAGYSSYDGLELASVLGPQIVQLNPSLAAVTAIASLPSFENQTGIPGPLNLSSVAAILNYNSQNVSEVNTSGIDFDLSYKDKLAFADIETGVDGTYVIKLDNQFESTTPVSSILNTVNNPINLRMRARGIASRDGVQFGIFLNYANSYTNNRGLVPVPIASWTTTDLNLSYKFPSENKAFHGTSIAINVKNVMNANPPFVAALPGYPINYDGTNANPLGRYISVEFGKRW